jgi:ribosomal-protein-alanine N-acetyltransferase
MNWFTRLFGGATRISDASVRDAADFSSLHAASFHRGWSDGEFEQFLSDRNVIAHRATRRGRLAGFILSRAVAGEAEVLSIAVSTGERGRGVGRRLLDWHLRRLAGLGCRTVFLEVDETNEPACRLYRRSGFREVGRRDSYYRSGANISSALVLRRDFS